MRRHHDELIDPPAPEGFQRDGRTEERIRYEALLRQRAYERFGSKRYRPTEQEIKAFVQEVKQEFLTARKAEVTPEMEAAAAQAEKEWAEAQLARATQTARDKENS